MTAPEQSGPFKSVCATENPVLCQTLRESLAAAGVSNSFVQELNKENLSGAQLVFVDSASRKSTGVSELLQMIGEGGQLIVLGESLTDLDLVQCVRDHPMNHLISESDTPDSDELVVTARKLLGTDIFGLEKYLGWGAEITERPIASYDAKRDTLVEIVAAARGSGARRRLVSCIECVTDELLMNAMYDAPAVREGVPHGARVLEALADTSQKNEKCATLRYGCDGRHFGVSVTDLYGELHREVIMEHLLQARLSGGRPRVSGSKYDGAGLGLYFVLSSATRFIANIEKGQRTEIICLFDMRLKARQMGDCTRSLHIFLQ